jgi:hypothetical protein
MSDIIYTPPASSGGGQNPTTNYIPLNNGTSNFVDSFIFNDKTNGLLYFTNDYGLTGFGLTCDNVSSYYAFGDLTNGGTFEGSLGVAYVIGDILVSLSSANKQEVINDGQNQIIKTQDQNGIQGIYLSFNSFEYFFGDFNGVNNQTYIFIKDQGKDILFNTIGGTIRHNCDLLQFDGALTSGSSGGNSGQHLQVTINGNQYKIKLENP